VKARVALVQQSLPEGVRIVPYLDRSDLIGRAIGTVQKNLIEGGVIVVFVLVLLLGNLRAGLIVASAIPLAMLFALVCMHVFGVSANLMSLGAIDFGLIVDGAVIVTEGILYRMHTTHVGKTLSRSEMNNAVEGAARQVRQSAAFGEVIILIVYLPILALSGIEGKMFKPMALTVSFAIVGGLLLSMTYVPMMASLVLSRRIRAEHSFADRLVARIQRAYLPLLKWALRRKGWIIVVASALFVGSVGLFSQMGANFIPKLEEGDFAVELRMPPGTTLDKMVQQTTALERQLLQQFPEVKQVVSKIGSSDVPTDPMPTNAADVMVILHPKDQWRRAQSQEELATQMKAALHLPGAEIEFQQPIAMRFNELMTGAKSDIAVMIYGDNIQDLGRLGNEAAKHIQGIAGAADVKVEQVDGLPKVRIRYQRERLATYGLNIGQVNLLVRAAFAGEHAGIFYEGERRHDIVVRLQADYRTHLQDLGQLPLMLASGDYIRLADVADITIENGPALIARENTRRRIIVGVNVRDRDVESVVADIQTTLKQQLRLPTGYTIAYGGEFENLRAASQRLSVAVPIALGLIFLLLYFTLHSVRHALLIFTAIPLSAIGGILALWGRGMPFSISAGIGFIALFGVSVLNGIVLVSYLNRMRTEGHTHRHGLVMRGALQRLRPVLMTASVAALGFLPMAISTEAGAEVQKPLATVVMGGLVSSTLLTLLLLPVLYSMPALRLRWHKEGALLLLLLCIGASAQAQPTRSVGEAEALEMAERQNLARLSVQTQLQAGASAQASQPLLGPLQVNYTYGQLNTTAMDHNVQALQPLPAWALYRARRDELAAQYGALAAADALASRQLQLEVRLAYHTAVYQTQRMAVLRQARAHYATLLQLDRLRVQTGEAGPVDSLASHTRWQATGWELEQARSARLQAQIALQALLQDTLLPMPRDTVLVLPPLLDTAAWEIAHPLVQVEQARLCVAEAQARQAQAQNRPQLAVGYFYQTLDYQPGYQGVQVALTLPHALRANQSRVRAAQQAAQAQDLYAQSQARALQARRQQLLNDLARLQQGLLYYTNEALPLAETLHKNALLARRAGEIGHAEYLIHLNHLNTQRLLLLDTQWQYLQTRFHLDFLQ
jgi:cobalt-zinc-cadmium resistance protein CzcA